MLVCPVSGIGKKRVRGWPEQKILIGFPPEQKRKREKNGPDPLAALKQWGEDAKVAVEAKAKQLHWRNSFKPVHWKDVNKEKQKQILELHVFVKKKCTGQIKARKVAGGNKQRDFISKENASSSTVATESVLLTSLVDAQENRDIAIVDIPNAFI